MIKIFIFFSSMILSFSSFAKESCTFPVKLILKQSPKGLQVEYRAGKPYTALKLNASKETESAFLNINQRENIAHHSSNIVLMNEKGLTTSFLLSPLNKYINATYAPYVNLGDSHGVFMTAITPIAMKIKPDDEWESLEENCITFFAEKDKKLVSVEKKNNFLIFNFNEESVLVSKKSKFNFIFNDNLPQWLSDLITENFKKFHSYYSKELALSNDKKLTIVASFESPESDFYDGGVHNGNTFVLRFGGKRYLNFSPAIAQHLEQFIAHEVFHIWTSNDSHEPHWLSEGGAEFAANIAKLNLKLIDREQFDTQNNLQKLTCSLEHSYKVIPGTQYWPGRYSCGHAFLHHLIGEKQFFHYWRQKLLNTRENSLNHFVSNISPESKTALGALTSGNSTPPPEEAIIKSYQQLIGEIIINKSTPNHILKKAIFRHFMTSACDGFFSFETREERVRIYQHSSCPSSFEKANGYIEKINSLDIQSDGYLLLDSYNKSCSTRGVLTVEGKEFSADLPCKFSPSIFKNFRIQ